MLFLIFRQFLHGPKKVRGLRQDGVFQHRVVGDEDVRGGHTAYGGIEMFEELVGDAGGDFGAVSPAQGVFVGDQCAAGFYEAAMVSQSKGFRVRRSISSALTPCSRSSFCTACNARGTTAP